MLGPGARRNLWQVQCAGAGRALLTSDIVKLHAVRNRARDGACCDDTCCDARGVMHEYIMAIFLGKSENQEGGVCLLLRWVEISHCVWRMHSEGTGLVGRAVKGPFSKKNYFF